MLKLTQTEVYFLIRHKKAAGGIYIVQILSVVPCIVLILYNSSMVGYIYARPRGAPNTPCKGDLTQKAECVRYGYKFLMVLTHWFFLGKLELEAQSI